MHTNIQNIPSVEVVTLTKTAFELLVNRIQLLEQRYSHSEEKILSDQLFTQEQVESMLGVSRATLKRYRNQGRIRYIQFGKTIRFRQSDIQEFQNHFRKGQRIAC